MNNICPLYKSAVIQGLMSYGKTMFAVDEILSGEDTKIEDSIQKIILCDYENCVIYDKKKKVCKGVRL